MKISLGGDLRLPGKSGQVFPFANGSQRPSDWPRPSEVADDWDDLDDEERAALHPSLRESIEQINAGQTIDLEQALAELRAHP